MLRKLYKQRLLVTVLCAALAMNYPLLMLASEPRLVFGLPVLFLYLFGLWLLLILGVRRLVKQLKHYYPDDKLEQDPNA